MTIEQEDTYGAERLWGEGTVLTEGLGESFIRELHGQVVCHPWWTTKVAGGAYQAPTVKLVKAHGNALTSSYLSYKNTIRVHAEQWTLKTYTHEMAHALDDRFYGGSNAHNGHTETFRASHVGVVEAVLGADWASDLLRLYEGSGLAVERPLRSEHAPILNWALLSYDEIARTPRPEHPEILAERVHGALAL